MTIHPARAAEAHITVRSFGTLRDALGHDEISLSVPGDDATLHHVLLRLEEVYGEPVREQLRDALSGEFIPFLVMLNDQAIPISRRCDVSVKQGDRVTILLPIDGG